MNGDAVPSRRDMRMSDADREQVLARLSAAVAEGRLTLTEFEDRVDGVLRTRAYGEVEPFVADLPDAAAPVAAEVAADDVVAAEVVELRGHGGHIRRNGYWLVPRRLVVRCKGGLLKLDLRHAAINHRVVEIELAAQGGSTTIVLPAGRDRQHRSGHDERGHGEGRGPVGARAGLNRPAHRHQR